MEKSVIFLVHGVGVKDEGWEKGVIETLTEASKKYPFFKDSALSKHVEFVPLGYDDVFRKLVDSWENSTKELQRLREETPGLSDLFNWIEGLSVDSQKFVWNHAMDVVFYRFHAPTRNLIRTRIAKEMAKKIDSVLDKNAFTSVSVVAHSLGTMVAHDAIHYLGNHPWGGQPNPFGPKYWRFSSIAMIANTTGLLQTEVSPDNSIVRPGTDETAYFYHYINARHDWDPVPWPRAFSTEQFPADGTTDVRVNHFHELNVHSWTNYLKHPRVHIPILRGSLGDYTITAEDERKAVKAFSRWGGQSEAIAEQIQGHLDDWRIDVDPNPSPLQLAQLFLDVKERADELKKLVTALQEGGEN